MKIVYTLILSLFVICITNAQTTYTFTPQSGAIGDYNDPANWDSFPPTTIAAGDKIVIPAGTTCNANHNGTLDNNGTVEVLGELITSGTAGSPTDAFLTTNFNVANNGLFLNKNLFTSNGFFNNAGTFINDTGATHQNDRKPFTIEVIGQYINRGTLNNDKSFQNYGVLFNDNGIINNVSTANIINLGLLEGATTTNYNGDFINQGSLSPKNTAGTAALFGFENSVSLGYSSNLIIDIYSDNSHDEVFALEDVSIDTETTITANLHYTPNIGDRFTILTGQSITGEFETNLSILPQGLGWAIHYNATSVELEVIDGTFITTWQTTLANENITIPTAGGGIDYTVDWGDGTVNTNVSGDATHMYAMPGVHTVVISGDFRRIYFNDTGDKDKILSVEQWGVIQWQTSLDGAFKGCTNLEINATDAPDLSLITNLAGMFDGATSMNQPLLNWDVSTIDNMDGMFRNTPFNQDISGWDVSNVSVFTFMFEDAAAFNQDISGWTIRTGAPVNMAGMFRGATVFNQNIGSWNVTWVTNMVGMFERAENFQGDIGLWGVKTFGVVNMANMFRDATLFNDNITNWNTASVTDMANMFHNAATFNQEIGSWNVFNVGIMESMFEGATNFNGNISNWDVTSVTNMFAMFDSASSFNQPIGAWGFKTANVEDFGNMFADAVSFNQDISSWSTGNSLYFNEMFSGATSFNQDIGGWDVSSAEFMAFAFENATSFDQDLSGWNVSNAGDVYGMFDGVTLSTANYDALLTAWSGLILQPDLQFSGGNSQYCASAADRTTIINDFGWSIGDGGIEAGCQPTACLATTTYTGGMWDNGLPNINTTAIINESYSTAIESIDACTIIINDPAILTVAPLTYINTLGNITVGLNARLIVKHTGSVVQADDTASTINNGDIEVQITTPLLKPRDFMILGSPMTNDTPEGVINTIFRKREHDTGAFLPHPAVQAMFPNGTNFVDIDNNDWTQDATVFSPGEGYLVWPQESLLLGNLEYPLLFSQTSAEGTLNNGDVAYTLGFNTPGPTAVENKNASPNNIANPYPSAISATDFILANDAVDEVYFWEHNTTPDASFPGANSANFNMADISVYNEMGGVPAATGGTTPNDYIATAQGFGIKNNGTAATIQFTNAMRRKNNNNTLRSLEDEEKNRIWLSVKNTTYDLGNTTLIGFTQDATPFFEAKYDSPRLGTPVSLYSHLIDGSKALAIQGRETFTAEAQIGIGFSTQINNDDERYIISIKQLVGQKIEQTRVYLHDNLLGIKTNISEEPYEFTSQEGIFDNRFTLLFKDDEVLSVTDNDLNLVTLYPNPTDGILTIVTPNSLMKSVEVQDVLGRLIQVGNSTNENNTTIDLTLEKDGVYFIKVNFIQGSSITKRVIKAN